MAKDTKAIKEMLYPLVEKALKDNKKKKAYMKVLLFNLIL